jgi:acyl carrier protein
MSKITRAEIEWKVKDLLINVECVPEDKILPEAKLMEDFEMDSLDMVQLIMHIEKAFSLVDTDEKVYELHSCTYKQLCDFIENEIHTL